MKWIIVLSLVLLAACQMGPEEPVSISFRLTGTVAHADVEWKDGTGVHSENNVEIPWTLDDHAYGGTDLRLTGTKVTSSGRLTVAIVIDGESVWDATEEPFGVVTVTATVPE